MTSFDIAKAQDVLDALAETARESPRVFYTLVNGSILPPAAKRIEARLNKEPGRVKRPIDWASEKQRRAFFATNGFGRGIPTIRTGKVRSWKVVLTPFKKGTFDITAENPVYHSQFVYGPRQQRFHRNTGWPNKEQIAREESAILQDDLIDGWFSITNPGKGVRFR